MSLPARITVSVLAVLVALNLAVTLVNKFTGGANPGGAPGQVESTAPDGLAGFATQLGMNGHAVSVLTTSAGVRSAPENSTVFFADGSVGNDSVIAALESFVESGGNLVVCGVGPFVQLSQYLSAWGAPRMGMISPDGWGVAHSVGNNPQVSDVRTVDFGIGKGSWVGGRDATALLVSGRNVLASTLQIERGRVTLLASASPLTNSNLATDDDAAFGLDLAAPDGRPVSFVEAGAQSAGAGSGLAALPPNWQWAIVILGGAVLFWMLATGRRLGPPVPRERPMAPGRRLHVEALAELVAKSRDPAAAGEPVRQAARRRLARRCRLGEDAPDAQLRDVASEAGITPDIVDAVMQPARTEADLLTVGWALSRLEQQGKRP